MQNLNSYWRRSIDTLGLVGVIATLVLLPLDRLPYAHHIPFSLGFISLVVLLLATAGRLFDRCLEKDWAQLKRYLFVGLLIALPAIGYLVSITYAIDRAFALSATKLLLAVVLRAFCFFVLISETPALWGTIKKTIYIVTGAVIGFGLFQYFFDVFGASQHITDLRSCCTSNSTYVFPRVHSTALEPLYLDHYLMIPLWLLTFDFWRDKATRKNKLLLALFIGTATIFILTVARSATISLILAAAIFYAGARKAHDFKKFFKYMLKAWGSAVLLAAVLVLISGIAAIFIPKNSIHHNSGVGSLGLFGSHAVSIDDGSAKTRYSLWPKAIGYIEEKPLQGVGAYNSRIRLNLSQYKQGAEPSGLQPFNNDLLGILVDLGLLGILVFGPLFVALTLIVYRLYKSEWQATTAPLALALIAMLLQSNFFHSLLLTRLWVVIGLLLPLLYISPLEQKILGHKK